jgi:hypothetical protein
VRHLFYKQDMWKFVSMSHMIAPHTQNKTIARRFIQGIFSKDIEVTIVDDIEEQNKVALRWTLKATP